MSKEARNRNRTDTLGFGNPAHFHPYKQRPPKQPPAPLATLAAKVSGGNLDTVLFEEQDEPYAAALAKIKAEDKGTLVGILGLEPSGKVVSTMFDAIEAMLVDLPTKIATRGAEMLQRAIASGSLLAVQVLLMAGADPNEDVPGTGETLYDYGQRKGTEEIKDRLDVWRESQAKKRTE